MTEIEQLQKAIDMLEAQRLVLGDAVVNAAQAPLVQKLSSLQQETVKEQRKLVTVLFADLVDFTRMGEQMDPEDVREVMHDYFTLWTDRIEAYGGVVEKFIGDAVMAVFGLHTAREDDSERAVFAALAMRDALEDLNTRLEAERGVRLSMRVGIHTGQVVVSFLSERKGQDFFVIGDTVNLASRLQSAAPVNQILISHETFRLVRGRFNFQPLEPIQVKGKREPVRAYLVTRAKPKALRFESTHAETPVVGREKEMGVLSDYLRRSIDHRRQHSVIILAEAGMGKSRLVEDFEYRLELLPEVIRYYKGRTSSYMQNQPYALVRDLIAFRLHIEEDDPPEVVLETLKANLGDAQASRLVARLLGFSSGAEAHESVLMDAQLLHDQALAAIIGYFRRSADEWPMVIVLEDLQWADESSLEMVDRLRQELVDRPVLWVVAARPDLLARLPHWAEALPDQTRLELRPMTRDESATFLKLLLPQIAQPYLRGFPPPEEGLPEEVETLLTSSAEGNPFYLEELLRMLLDDGVIVPTDHNWEVDQERLAGVRIPSSLTEFLQARLDSLPVEERNVLQRAAVIGRVFWDQAVEYLRVGATGESRFAGQPTSLVLDRLSNFDIILRRDVAAFEGTREYLFTHSMFRDVTYDSLLRRQRRIYHAQAARWLEEITEGARRVDEYAGLVAEHYAQAEENEAAASWYRRAGDFAAARFANAEAVYNYTRALDLLDPLDLESRFRILAAREKVHDHQGSRVEQAADVEAMEQLASQMDGVQQAEALLRRANLFFLQDDNSQAVETVRKVIPLAQAAGQARLQVEAHLLWGRALLWQSEHDEARQRLELALEQAWVEQMPEAEADCLWNLGVVACNVGEYVKAHNLLQQAIQVYRQLGDQVGEATAYAQQGVAFYSQSDYQNAKVCFETSLEIFHVIGHRAREATMYNNLGAIAHEQGNVSEALRMHLRALDLNQAIGDKYGVSTSNSNLGDCLRDLGEYEQAWQVYNNALQIIETTGDRYVATTVLASICLFYIQTGNLTLAVQYGEEAVDAARESGALQYGCAAHSRLAQAYLLIGRFDDAEANFRAAMETQARLEMDNNVLESKSGLAGAAYARGDLAGAVQVVESILPALEGNELHGCDEPARLYMTVYRILKSAGHTRAHEVVQAGQTLVRTFADRIDNPTDRQSFLEKVCTNRELMELVTV